MRLRAEHDCRPAGGKESRHPQTQTHISTPASTSRSLFLWLSDTTGTCLVDDCKGAYGAAVFFTVNDATESPLAEDCGYATVACSLLHAKSAACLQKKEACGWTAQLGLRHSSAHLKKGACLS